MVFAAAVNRGLGSRTGAGRVSRELPTEPRPPRALKPPLSRSRAKWGVVAPPGLDPRLSAQLRQEAAENGAELVALTSPREAASQRVTMLIELVEAPGGTGSFASVLKRAAGPAAARLTPALASQGFIMAVTYSSRS